MKLTDKKKIDTIRENIKKLDKEKIDKISMKLDKVKITKQIMMEDNIREEIKILGKVRIGQKKKRGIKGDTNPIYKNYKNIDVTSGSMNKINGKLVKEDLSPMLIGPVIDKQGVKAKIFENYWQYGKLWLKAGHIKMITSKNVNLPKNGIYFAKKVTI